MKTILCPVKIVTVLSVLFLFCAFPTIAQPEPALAWGKKIGNSGSTGAGLVTYDNQGNTYIISILVNTSITINGTTVSAGSSGKPILIKYDVSGIAVWLKEIPFAFLTYGNVNHHKFICRNNSLYLFTTYSQNNIVLDGFSFPPYQAGTLAGDLVLMKINISTQQTEWIKTIARPQSLSTIPSDDMGIYFDQENNIHALGTFTRGFIFDSGDTLSYYSNNTEVDAYHVVYDTLGNIKSAHNLGIINSNLGNYSYEYFHMDQDKNVYRFVKDTKTFIKYNEQGDTLFTKTFSSDATITGMTVDPWQNVFLSGYFSAATASFDGLSTTKTGGTTDGILVKFNSNDGTVEWLKNQGYAACDRYDYINSDAIGNVYVLNEQYGICVSPRMSLLVKYNNNGEKIWEKPIDIAIDPGINTSTQAMVRASNISISPDGGTIILTGVYRGGINLDSSLSFGGHGENSVGFVAQYGVCNTTSPTLTVSNQQFCAGDSALLSVVPTPGYSYLWSNGDTTSTTLYVNSSGNYSVVAIQDEECYAQSQEFYFTENQLPDVSVTIQQETLTAVAGNSYQWLDCNNNHTPIAGANQVSFTPVQNGEYAVKVTSPAGCTDTSACFVINNLSIDDIDMNQSISIFPNPTKDEVNIRGMIAIEFVRILDLQGKEILRATGNKLTVSGISPGVYLMEVNGSGGTGVKRFVKQ